MDLVEYAEEQHFFDGETFHSNGEAIFSNFNYIDQPDLGGVWVIPEGVRRQERDIDVENKLNHIRILLLEEFKGAGLVIARTGTTHDDLERAFAKLMLTVEILRNEIYNRREDKIFWRARGRKLLNVLKHLEKGREYAKNMGSSLLGAGLNQYNRNILLNMLRRGVVAAKWLF